MGSDSPSATLRAAIELFNRAEYLAAHELFEELWEATEGPDSDFYKGLIQASISLYHFTEGNLDGAAKLHSGHRRYLAAYLPTYLGLDTTGFLEGMRRFMQPVLARTPGAGVRFEHELRPRITSSR